ncbi:predicted protein [Histoplasma capsulatum G186AR]|uniref:Uncharacterized protein n=1 Tax=Ajellomyces capsulatus (strain G186AR / H82 / ATCC MYA-2454 / RMSCC 2432) TaxID=447093 RepID=C0NI16_AJECG|nr:uncharacterized protein HCBG_02988 [Histoplasma capsulatum G186AR]EEH09451.1 predicted protein [Histoplasma capsulatum G186AR]
MKKTPPPPDRKRAKARGNAMFEEPSSEPPPFFRKEKAACRPSATRASRDRSQKQQQEEEEEQKPSAVLKRRRYSNAALHRWLRVALHCVPFKRRGMLESQDPTFQDARSGIRKKQLRFRVWRCSAATLESRGVMTSSVGSRRDFLLEEQDRTGHDALDGRGARGENRAKFLMSPVERRTENGEERTGIIEA